LVEGLPPAAEYRFKHALVQDAAYEILMKSRRRIIHRRVAATLEEKFPEIVVTQPALLAHHCSEAGLMEKAVGYWLVAGQQSVARSAAMEAVVQLRKGLELLSRVSDAAWRQQHELDLQMTLGRALIATSGHAASEPGEAFARARQLCDELDRPPQLVPVLFGQFTFHLIRGELEQAERKAEEVAQLSKTGNNPRWSLLARWPVVTHVSIRASLSEPAPTMTTRCCYGTRHIVTPIRHRRMLWLAASSISIEHCSASAT